ncbi:TlpA family protein disulfide reductase [Aeromicrobium fastidiosum]|uniref:Thioredoxin family protein n=1 Tax=Aeromicrobium fastidiosum TaxID=52699 RepID=A0A641AP25_9ACTN|nr:thioredoxin family protein [Aeromicrobium fastidiosum]KAA1379844.1 thioredoxin family protein [Aeromicrobium fastidiosum]MBP2389340.1 thiol-disulfide isomerase/thioredoxin [Aeromicrobium fastidiosum]
MTGLLVLAAALLATIVIAAALRWKNGRFSTVAAPAVTDDRERLTPDQIGASLGDRATLVQFSSAFCSPCRATRVLLADIAATVPGVETVEIDAESHLQLVRDLDVRRTPTVLVLDAAGTVTTRASGLPRRDQVMAALARAADVEK